MIKEENDMRMQRTLHTCIPIYKAKDLSREKLNSSKAYNQLLDAAKRSLILSLQILIH